MSTLSHVTEQRLTRMEPPSLFPSADGTPLPSPGTGGASPPETPRTVGGAAALSLSTTELKEGNLVLIPPGFPSLRLSLEWRQGRLHAEGHGLGLR